MRIPLEVAASTRVRFYCNLACEITRPSVSASGSASVSQLVHGSVLLLRFRRSLQFRHARLDVFDLDGFGRVVEEALGGAFR